MEKTCKNCGTPITKEYCEDNYPEVCEHWTPKKPKTNADRCVCCGEIIPEGAQMCPNCLVAVNKSGSTNRN